MSLYPVNSCIMQSVSDLYFCYETEFTITTLFSEEQNTLPKYVTKNSVFFFFLHHCKAGFSGQGKIVLAVWRHT